MIPLTAAEARRLFNLHTRVSPAAGIPRALVRLETLPAGQRPEITLRPPDQQSRGAVVVLEGCKLITRPFALALARRPHEVQV